MAAVVFTPHPGGSVVVLVQGFPGNQLQPFPTGRRHQLDMMACAGHGKEGALVQLTNTFRPKACHTPQGPTAAPSWPFRPIFRAHESGRWIPLAQILLSMDKFARAKDAWTLYAPKTTENNQGGATPSALAVSRVPLPLPPLLLQWDGAPCGWSGTTQTRVDPNRTHALLLLSQVASVACLPTCGPFQWWKLMRACCLVCSRRPHVHFISRTISRRRWTLVSAVIAAPHHTFAGGAVPSRHRPVVVVRVFCFEANTCGGQLARVRVLAGFLRQPASSLIGTRSCALVWQAPLYCSSHLPRCHLAKGHRPGNIPANCRVCHTNNTTRVCGCGCGCGVCVWVGPHVS
jgi:hypothetical protein